MTRATAVLITRGDVDLSEILSRLNAAEEVLIWDNSLAIDLGPFGQFARAASQISQSDYDTDILYFQDDDVITDPAAIIAAWEPGKIVCNMPETHRPNYEGQPDKLMGFGSCFERSLIRPTFERYFKHFEIDKVLLREPGRIFTGLNQERIKLVDVPKRDLPWADAPNRLYRQPEHLMYAEVARVRIRTILEMELRNNPRPNSAPVGAQ